jgi:hypothetical protein
LCEDLQKTTRSSLQPFKDILSLEAPQYEIAIKAARSNEIGMAMSKAQYVILKFTNVETKDGHGAGVNYSQHTAPREHGRLSSWGRLAQSSSEGKIFTFS